MNVAIIPVREFKDTKLRLRKFLDASERAQLTRAFLNHVLEAIQRSDIQGVIIVASDKREVNRLATAFPKAYVLKEQRHHGGVNRAMEEGINYARNKFKNVDSIMLIPSDLPLLSTKALNAVISELKSYDLILAPSAKRDGTDLILFNISKGEIPFHYDDNSYKKHVAEARRRKIRYKVYHSKEFLFDIDSPGDFRKLMEELKVRTFQELTHKLHRLESD
jgi:2-phospho-L-lactate/phosphoenolpyruvate guanylyltransferase